MLHPIEYIILHRGTKSFIQAGQAQGTSCDVENFQLNLHVGPCTWFGHFGLVHSALLIKSIRARNPYLGEYKRFSKQNFQRFSLFSNRSNSLNI